MEKVDVRNRRDQSTPGRIDGPSPRTHYRPLLIDSFDCPLPRPPSYKRTSVDGSMGGGSFSGLP
jgi:hypothetical protein